MNTQSLLLDLVRGSLVLGAALLAMPLLRAASAGVRRAVLLAAFAVSVLAPVATRVVAHTPVAPYVALPVVVRSVPAEPLVWGAASTAVSESIPTDAPAAARTNVIDRAASALPWLGAFMWCLGALIVAARLVLGLARARRLVARSDARAAEPIAAVAAAAAQAAGVSAPIALSDDVDAPAVVGLLSPVVLLPRDALAWSDARLRAVLLHELAHVRRRDCAAFAAVQLACALRWFDPLAWIAAARLRRERELAADESVLAAGVLPSSYATDLLAIAEPASLAAARARGAFALGMAASRSEIAARVEAIVSAPRAARSASLHALVAAFAALALGAVAACAGTPDSPTASIAPAPSPSSIESSRGAALADGSTLDPRLQSAADDEVARLLAEYSASAATVIVLEPRTGAILALASPETARRPVVPGSTFKMVTLAAALDSGALTLDQKLDCSAGSRAYGARTMRDATPYGVLSIGEALAVSSNVAATRMFDAIGDATLARYTERFHLPAAPPAPPGEGADFDRAMVAIGGGFRATPLDMAAAYAVIANDGLYAAPSTVRGAVASERVVRAETAREVRGVLEGVVQGERATGKRARIDGVRVAGKTGTSEWTWGCCGEPGTDDGEHEHTFSSFVGIVPADAPRFVVLVGVLDPKDDAPGGVAAAPVFARVASLALAR